MKEHHLKKFFELSQKSLGEIPQLEDPTEEQSEWINRRMQELHSWEVIIIMFENWTFEEWQTILIEKRENLKTL